MQNMISKSVDESKVIVNTSDEIIVFGLGEAWKKYGKDLVKTNTVAGLVDNSVYRQGTKEEGFIVQSADILKGFKGKIVIGTTYKSFPAILQQIDQYGINANSVFLLQYSVYDKTIELIPSIPEALAIKDKNLMYYDCVRNETNFADKRIVFFCSFYTVYLERLIENVKKRYPGYSLSIITESFNYKPNVERYVDHMYVYSTFGELGNILEKMEKQDVFQTLWIEHVWCYFYRLMRDKCYKLNLFIGGSDLYRSDDVGLRYKKCLIDTADLISGETPETIASFTRVYPEAAFKMKCVIHGVGTIDLIDKVELSRSEICEKYDLPNDGIIVTCGHNANKAHQHMKMINAIKKMPYEVIEKVCFVFPMAYNSVNKEYIDEIKNELESFDVDYRILTRFLNEIEMAEYATISDVMVHVQTTDQLSSTMLEEMYAGSIIIAGSWLPYGSLMDAGIQFETVDNISELAEVLPEVIRELQLKKEICTNNRAIVRKMFSWDKVIRGWHDAWL